MSLYTSKALSFRNRSNLERFRSIISRVSLCKNSDFNKLDSKYNLNSRFQLMLISKKPRKYSALTDFNRLVLYSHMETKTHYDRLYWNCMNPFKSAE